MKVNIRRISALVVVLALAITLALVGCQPKAKQLAPKKVEKKYYTPTTLRIGLIPNIAPEKQAAKYQSLGDYMEKKLGVPVELFVATNYTGVVQAMVSGKLDLAYFGGLTYAQTLEQVPVEPIVTEIDRETNTREYWSYIVTRPDSGINSLEDLKGRTFAFGDPSSTSGSLYPRIMLVEAEYDWEKDFAPIKQVIYTGGHDATAEAVVSGKVDAGGIEGRILNRLIKEGKIDGSKIKVISKRLVLGYPWCVRKDLEPAFRKKIVAAFKSVDDPTLLDLMRAVRYVEVNENDYEPLRKKAKELGLVSPAK
jgi:phosphonate transport system substrate-binding protein